MSLQCRDRCIEREGNTYRKNKEFNPVNNCCEILVIGLSSRILTKHITNISSVRDSCEIKPRKNKRPVMDLPPHTPALLSVCPNLLALSFLRVFPPPCGWDGPFLQKLAPPLSKSTLMVFSPASTSPWTYRPKFYPLPVDSGVPHQLLLYIY